MLILGKPRFMHEPKLVEHAPRDIEILLFEGVKEGEEVYKSISRGFAFSDLYIDGGPRTALMLKFDSDGNLRFDVFGYDSLDNFSFRYKDALEVSYDENVLFYRTENGWFGIDADNGKDFFVGRIKIAYNLFASKYKSGMTNLGWYDTDAEEFNTANYGRLLFEKKKNADDIEVVAALNPNTEFWDIFEMGEPICSPFYKIRNGAECFVFRYGDDSYGLVYRVLDDLPEGIIGEERMVLIYDNSRKNYGKVILFCKDENKCLSGKINIVNGSVLIVDDEIISFEDEE